MAGISHIKTLERTIGTNAAPKAVQAKTTLLKIVSGANKENKVAKNTTTMIASRAVFKVDAVSYTHLTLPTSDLV